MRSGEVRVLIGSTQKMGAGTNAQRKLIALHHMDCPWRPSDLQQREGRIIRQGNENSKVDIYTYVTENTFAKQEVEKPFPREEELKAKSARLDQLNILLNMDKRENEIVDGMQDEGEIQPQRESRGWDR